MAIEFYKIIYRLVYKFHTSMNLPKIVSSQTKIRFQHCDPFNHLNNGSYIDYFMNHREDQLIMHYDIDIYKMVLIFIS